MYIKLQKAMKGKIYRLLSKSKRIFSLKNNTVGEKIFLGGKLVDVNQCIKFGTFNSIYSYKIEVDFEFQSEKVVLKL